MRIARWTSRIAIALTALLGAACALEGPFERTNPFDIEGVLQLTLVGPDSAVFAGQRVRFTVTADRPLPPGDLLIGWRSSDPLKLIAGTNGEYVVTGATAQFVPVEIAAEFDSVRVVRTVLVGQKAATLDLWCGPAGGPAVACDATPVGVGATFLVRTTMADSSTTPLRSPIFALQRAVLSSSDSAVARPAANAAGNGTLAWQALSPGQAWLRARVDGVLDSVRVVIAP